MHLCASIDHYAKLVPHGKWYTTEQLATLEDTLKKSFLKREILNSEDTKKMLEEQGQDLALLSPTEFGKFMMAETAKWGKVIKEGHIKVE